MNQSRILWRNLFIPRRCLLLMTSPSSYIYTLSFINHFFLIRGFVNSKQCPLTIFLIIPCHRQKSIRRRHFRIGASHLQFRSHARHTWSGLKPSAATDLLSEPLRKHSERKRYQRKAAAMYVQLVGLKTSDCPIHDRPRHQKTIFSHRTAPSRFERVGSHAQASQPSYQKDGPRSPRVLQRLFPRLERKGVVHHVPAHVLLVL